MLTVPQTDTGGLVEYTKASEKTFLKELGNITGRTFGRCPPPIQSGAQLTTPGDCLTKTQVSAKSKDEV